MPEHSPRTNSSRSLGGQESRDDPKIHVAGSAGNATVGEEGNKGAFFQ
jgi:hypothetical protein